MGACPSVGIEAPHTGAEYATPVEVCEAIRELMVPPEPKKRSIGFVVPEEKKPK